MALLLRLSVSAARPRDHDTGQVEGLRLVPQRRDLIALGTDLHLPQDAPPGWSRAATRCGARPDPMRAPRTALVVAAMTLRQPCIPVRVPFHAPITEPNRSPSTSANARPIVDSDGPGPERTPSSA